MGTAQNRLRRERKRSREIFERAEKVLVGGVNSPVRAFKSVGGEPLVIERGSGQYLHDADGNQLLDYVCSWGAMILGHPFDASGPGTQIDSQFTLLDHIVGWIYHLSNGVTFGVMYMAMIGDATKRSWLWAIALAAGLELALLFTPYIDFFRLNRTALFVLVTLAAHVIFGGALGLYTKRAARASSWGATLGRAAFS